MRYRALSGSFFKKSGLLVCLFILSGSGLFWIGNWWERHFAKIIDVEVSPDGRYVLEEYLPFQLLPPWVKGYEAPVFFRVYEVATRRLRYETPVVESADSRMGRVIWPSCADPILIINAHLSVSLESRGQSSCAQSGKLPIFSADVDGELSKASLHGDNLALIAPKRRALSIYKVDGYKPDFFLLWSITQQVEAFALSTDGNWLVVATVAGKKSVLRLINLRARVEVATVDLSSSPLQLWVKDGDQIGIFDRDGFKVLAVKDGSFADIPLYTRRDVYLLGYSSAFLLLVTSLADPLVLETSRWNELPQVAASIVRGVQSRQHLLGLRDMEGGGVLAAPISATFLDKHAFAGYARGPFHVCLANGKLLPQQPLIVENRHLFTLYQPSQTGNLFAVQTLPASDDPGFMQAECDCGLAVYETATGVQLAQFPWDLNKQKLYQRAGAISFVDNRFWYGFLSRDSSILFIDLLEGAVQLERLENASGAYLNPTSLDSVCPHP